MLYAASPLHARLLMPMCSISLNAPVLSHEQARLPSVPARLIRCACTAVQAPSICFPCTANLLSMHRCGGPGCAADARINAQAQWALPFLMHSPGADVEGGLPWRRFASSSSSAPSLAPFLSVSYAHHTSAAQNTLLQQRQQQQQQWRRRRRPTGGIPCSAAREHLVRHGLGVEG